MAKDEKGKRHHHESKGKSLYDTKENKRIEKLYMQATYPNQKQVDKQVRQFYENRFRNEHVRKNTGRHPEIDIRFEEEFNAWVQSGKKPLHYFYLGRSGGRSIGSRVLKDAFYLKNPELKDIDSFVSRNGRKVNIREKINAKLNHLWNSSVENDLVRKMSAEKVLSCLRENPIYPFIKDRKKATAAILKQIPDNIADLYPGARTLNRKFILHVGPTNSGKTYEALLACQKADRGVYLAPLRLLAMEAADRINRAGVPCDMITGEEERTIVGARHVASTIEMLAVDCYFDVAVIDEAQMIVDDDRGWAWTQAILGVSAPIVHVCMAEEALPIISKLILSCGDTYEVERHERQTPLSLERVPFHFPEDVRDGDALVVFSRKSVLEAASLLEDYNIKASVVYGALPYEARMAETEKFLSGKTRVVVATDAIGMGMNLPIKRIVFLETVKFDGKEKRPLNPSEIKQIAGRAGRRGYVEEGLVNTGYDKWMIKNGLEKKEEPIDTAKTAMPPFLIHMDQDLSLTMRDWLAVPDEGIFHKTDMKREIDLCVWLEQHCFFDKATALRAVSVPFNEEDRDLLDIWYQAMRNMNADRRVLEDIPIIQSEEGDSLDVLEKKYRSLDLLYSLQRSFGAWQFNHNQVKTEILDCKKDVAQAIIEQLTVSKNYYKCCKVCGKRLPWHYPYRLCDDCFEAEYIAKRQRNDKM